MKMSIVVAATTPNGPAARGFNRLWADVEAALR
jgi:hypothetical protein